MASYCATVEWSRNGAKFSDNKYSREHKWHFDGGITIAASSSPHVVPVPQSNPHAVDPEEALIAALSSCHMLTFLYLSAKKGFTVDEYTDEATGKMAKNAVGRMWVSEVILHPKISFSGHRLPTSEEIKVLHHESHEECFIANSVKTEVRVAD